MNMQSNRNSAATGLGCSFVARATAVASRAWTNVELNILLVHYALEAISYKIHYALEAIDCHVYNRTLIEP